MKKLDANQLTLLQGGEDWFWTGAACGLGGLLAIGAFVGTAGLGGTLVLATIAGGALGACSFGGLLALDPEN